MDLQLDNRHVLVTGSSRGIGRAVALAFLCEGARVTLLSRDAEKLDQTREALRREAGLGRDGDGDARPPRLATVAADLRDPTAALAALDRAEAGLGPVEILVNSAGAARRYGHEDLTPARWRDAMDAKYFTYIHMIDPAIKRMARRGAGVIVNVIGAGGKMASPTHLSGGAANAALMLATAGLARAYAGQGVRVNAVNPGLTETERLLEGLAVEARTEGISIEEARLRADARLPLGRIATAAEIANAVVFLASPRASYITGAIVAMDGAQSPMVV